MLRARTAGAAAVALVSFFGVSACGSTSSSTSGSKASTPATSSGSSSANNSNASAQATAADGRKTYTIKFSSQWNSDFPIVKAEQWFVDQVQKDSGGRLKVTLYINGVLAGASGTVTGVRNGSVQMGTLASNWIANGVPEVGALSLPFLFKSSDQMLKFLTSSPTGKQLATQTQQKLGINILGWYTIGLGAMFTTNKNIASPADLKGMKIRSGTNPVELDTLKAWGAVPVPLGNTETFSGLQSGTVKGLMLSPLNVSSDKYDEVLKHALLLNAEPFPAVMLINTKFYNSLPADLQDVLSKDAQLATQKELDFWNSQEQSAVDTMKSHGVTVTVPTDAQIQEFRDASKSVYDSAAKQFGADFVSQLEAAGQ